MIFCPDKNDKDFKLMVKHLGVDLAYHLWDKNKGYPIHLNETGGKSELYQSLLKEYGNEKDAMIAKSKIYSDSFKKQYGDWQGDKITHKDKLDKNGEPKLSFGTVKPVSSKENMGITKTQLGDYNQRQYHNEVWNRLVSHFNSHRERDPKIGERMISYGSYEIRYINARGNAVPNGIKDKLRSQIGDRLNTKLSIKRLEDNLKEWKNKHGRNSVGIIKDFLFSMGLPQYAGTLTDHKADVILQDLERIPASLGKYVEESIPENENPTEVVNDENENRSTFQAEDILSKFHNNFLNNLTSSINLLDNLSRILSSNDAKGNRRFNAVLGSHAHKDLYNLINAKYPSKLTGKSKLGLQGVFKNAYFKNNIFINGINRMFNIIEDDGLIYDNYSGDKNAIAYRNEKREDFHFRKFVLGYLSSIGNSGDVRPHYNQFIYPNERKTPFGVEVRVLKRDELLNGIEATIKQISSRDRNNEKKYKGYNADSTLGFDILKEVLGDREIIGNVGDADIAEEELRKTGKTNYIDVKHLALEIYNKLDEKSHELTDHIIYDRTAFDNNMPMSSKLDNVVDKELYPDFKIGDLPTNRSGHLKLTETNEEYSIRTGEDISEAYAKGIEKEYLIKPEHIQPLISNYFINNYLNGFHFAQVVAGDLASFENVASLVKRLSIAFAPGKSGFVNDKYGMKRYARAAVISDPVKDIQTVDGFIRRLLSNASVEEQDNIIKLFPTEGFKPGDSAAFILPERRDNINVGFGEDYGNVLKGVYFHKEEDTGAAKAVKYAQVVLTDELVLKHRPLEILRDKMRNNMVDNAGAPIDEMIFESGIKVGSPITTNDFYNLTNENSDFIIHPDSQFMMDNKDYRIQQDPEAELDSEVSYPTQLSYLMKLYGTNDIQAQQIYNSFARIILSNRAQLDDWMGDKPFKVILDRFLGNMKQDNLAELLSDGISHNFPSIADKIMGHYIGAIFDRTVKTKFDGTKLVLQTALGATKAFESKGLTLELPDHLKRELEITTDKDGRMYYEFVIPKGFMPKEMEKKIKDSLDKGQEPEDMFYANFGSKDLLGFDIPSSEMHSAYGMKVVGFYDSQGTNVVIGPKMLTVVHGRDYDIDSVFTIKRSIAEGYNKGLPVGYELQKDGKYHFNTDPSFLDNDPMLNDTTLNKDAKQLKRRVTEAYYLNQMMEGFMDGITKKENIERNISPIYLGELQDEKTRVMDTTGQKEEHLDISNAVHEQEIHNTVFSGDNGIGIFASQFKAIAFMHQSQKGHPTTSLKSEIKPTKEKLPEEQKKIVSKNETIKKLTGQFTEALEGDDEKIKAKTIKKLAEKLNTLQDTKIDITKTPKQLQSLIEKIYDKADEANSNIYSSQKVVGNEGFHIRFNGKNYDEIVDHDKDNNKEIGYRFDSLINAAVDNLKERILPYINVGRETIAPYSVLVAHGVGFKTINNFMSQPILRYFTKYGYRDAGYIHRRLTEYLSENSVKNLELNDADMEKYMKYSPEDVKKMLDSNTKDPEDIKFLNYQNTVYDQYNQLQDIGKAISQVRKLTNVIKSYPNDVAGMEDILSTAKSIMGIDQDKSITSEISDSKSSFPYYMDNFFTTNQHLYRSLENMENLVNKVNSEFITYHPIFRSIAKGIIRRTGIKMDFKNADTNEKLVRDEFVKFLMSSLINREGFRSIQVASGDKRKGIITLTGVRAFNKEFIDLVNQAQTYDHNKKVISERKGDKIKYSGNMFLNSLSSPRDRRTGVEQLTFYGPASMDSRDFNLYKQAFEQMRTFDVMLDKDGHFMKGPDGKYLFYEKAADDQEQYTNFQKRFVDYAIANFGMSFGLRNYSKVLPGKLYKETSDNLVRKMNDLLSEDPTALNRIRNAFEANIVLNHPEGLWGKRIKVDDHNIMNMTHMGNDPVTGELREEYSGKDPISGVYYDRAFRMRTDVVKDNWPLWHISKRNDVITVYRRISGESGISAYYERIGKQPVYPLYDLHSIEDAKNYVEEDHFGGNIKRVKGPVLRNSEYHNGYDIIEPDEKGEYPLLSISDWTDPGNMYSKTYEVTNKVGKDIYLLKEVKNYHNADYFDREGGEARKVYQDLFKRLRSKDTPFHGYDDRIIINKHDLNRARLFYQDINKNEFNGVKVLYEKQSGFGTEIMIDETKIKDFLYGRQLDILDGSYDSFGSIINEITGTERWNELTGMTSTISGAVNERLNSNHEAYAPKEVSSLMDDIASRTTNPFQKRMLNWVRPLVEKSKVSYIGHEDLPLNKLGKTKPTGDITIDINQLTAKGYTQKQIDRVIMHELVHSIANVQLYQDDAFRNEVKSWIKYIGDSMPHLKDKYKLAFKDENELGSEFVSEFFSNEEFYNELDNIKIPDKNKTIGQRIREWIGKIFGVEPTNHFSNMLDKWMRENINPRGNLTLDADGNYKDADGNKVLYKDIDSHFTDTDIDSPLTHIIDQGMDITNPEKEDGEKEDFYVDGAKNIYKRVADIYKGWLNYFREGSKGETFGERQANMMWSNTDKENKKKLDGVEYTYKEYKEEMDKRLVESSVRGSIVHLYNKMIVDRLNTGGKNEGVIKSEIQRIAYKDYTLVDSKGEKATFNISIDPDAYSWFETRIKDIYKAHDINVFDDIDQGLKDKIASEVTVASKELGIAGTADMIIEHADGTVSIKDMATGKNFDKYISSRLLKYGDQNRFIMDSPRDRKKMQIMTYAFMMKLNNPDVKFRDLSIMFVPNEYFATSKDPMRKVDVGDFLGIMETFLRDKDALKEAGIDPNVYDKIIKKAPKIFDASEYTYEFNEKTEGLGKVGDVLQDKLVHDNVVTSLTSNDLSPVKQTEKWLEELTKVINQAPVITKLGKSKYEDLSKTDQIKAINLTNKILQAIKDPEVMLNVSPEQDVSIITSWIGNYSDMPQPHVQMWKKFRDIQGEKAFKAYTEKSLEHNGLLNPVLDEYYKNNPNIFRNKKYMNFANYHKMFDWMYKEFDNNGSNDLRMVTKRDEEYGKLTDAQKNYVNFLNDHYASYFKGENAYANKLVSYIQKHDLMVPVTALELYNHGRAEHEQFRYYEGWFPKQYKSHSEMIYEAGEGNYLKGLLDKNFIKQQWLDSLTYYRENRYYGRNHNAMVLPFKYMGSINIDSKRAYTYNPEFQFDSFTKNMEYKKEMDRVYALGEGVRAFLDSQKFENQPMFANTSEMLEKKITGDVLGRTLRMQLTRKPIRIFGEEVRADAALMLMKNWTSATLLMFKPFAGFGNGLNAMMLQHKDSLRGSIGSLKLFGVDGDAIDTTLKDSLYGDKVYFSEYVPNLITGNLKKDKTWLLAKKLRYLADNYDFNTPEKYLLTPRNRATSQAVAYSTITIPYDAVSMITMVSQLNHLKHPTLKGKDGKAKSLWDCYEVKQMPNGEYDVVWNGGSRGLLKEGSGAATHYTEMNELLPHEIEKLKKSYERLQGAYRREEATAIEVYVMGKMFMQLKKYFPRVLMNAFSSKRSEMDLGYLKKTEERREGEDVYEWRQRVNEGRFALLGKFFLSSVMMNSGDPQYKWNNMPDSLKLHVIDAATTLGVWMSAYVAYLQMFGDDTKDNDTMKAWWKMYAMDNFIQQYSPKEMLKLGTSVMQPVALSRSLQTVTSFSTMMGATWDVAFGDKEKAYTLEGDFRGWNQFKKSIPFFASYADMANKMQKAGSLDNIFNLDRINKWK